MTTPTHNTTEEVTKEELNLLEKSLDGITPPFIQVEANSNVRNLLPRLLRAYREMKEKLSYRSELIDRQTDTILRLNGLVDKQLAQLAQKDALILQLEGINKDLLSDITRCQCLDEINDHEQTKNI